jgi:hypothetical protein
MCNHKCACKAHSTQRVVHFACWVECAITSARVKHLAWLKAPDVQVQRLTTRLECMHDEYSSVIQTTLARFNRQTLDPYIGHLLVVGEDTSGYQKE